MTFFEVTMILNTEKKEFCPPKLQITWKCNFDRIFQKKIYQIANNREVNIIYCIIACAKYHPSVRKIQEIKLVGKIRLHSSPEGSYSL